VKRERRQPTPRKCQRITTAPDRGPVVRRVLQKGQSPRSIARRYSALARRAIQRHQHVCLRAEDDAA
jgi:hypothetical protein